MCFRSPGSDQELGSVVSIEPDIWTYLLGELNMVNFAPVAKLWLQEKFLYIFSFFTFSYLEFMVFWNRLAKDFCWLGAIFHCSDTWSLLSILSLLSLLDVFL